MPQFPVREGGPARVEPPHLDGQSEIVRRLHVRGDAKSVFPGAHHEGPSLAGTHRRILMSVTRNARGFPLTDSVSMLTIDFPAALR